MDAYIRFIFMFDDFSNSNCPLMNTTTTYILRVHGSSRQRLVGFQRNFMGTFSIKGSCAYHVHVLVR